MNDLLISSFVVGAWWNPFSWGESIGNAVNALQATMNEWLVSGTRWALEQMTGIFNASINALSTEVAITPAEFDANLLTNLRDISNTVVLPIAGLLITYVFVLEIIEFVTDKNKGNEFDVGSVTFLIIKTAAIILLTTNAFTISLAFSDLSTWMIDQVPTEQVEITADITDQITEALEPEVVEIDEEGNTQPIEGLTEVEDEENQKMDYKLGEGLVTIALSLISLIFVLVIGGIIYLVAWSRIILVLLYVTVAPIPMATLMSESWVNSIGQNYLKNMLALTLQGFLMLVLLVIYSGLVSRTGSLIENGDNSWHGMMLLIVSMGVVAGMLMGTHNFAKSITGAN